MKMFRILRRSIRDAFKSVTRNFSLSLASITCSTITLILVAVAIVVSANVNNATAELKKDLTIEVFINLETEPSEIEKIKKEIAAIDNVEENNIKHITGDEWKAELVAESDDLKAILGTLEINPLMDSLEITVEDVDQISATTKTIREIDGVYDAKYGEGKAEKFIKMFDIIEKVTLVIVGALVIVSIFLIGNTIKLTIFSRRSQIDIMRLVGTSNIVIKLPFLFEGLILGIIGALIPALLTVYGYIITYDHLGGYIYSNIIPLIQPVNFVFIVAGVVIVLGGIVGMIGSYTAVRKHLKI